jgi:hypothetical protein
LGRFLPGADAIPPVTPPPLSDDEIQRRLQGPRYSTAEVLAKRSPLQTKSRRTISVDGDLSPLGNPIHRRPS